MMGWYGGAGWAAALAMGVFWLLLAGVVVWAVVRAAAPPDPGDDARRILDRRLASGEIDVATYRTLRDELDARPRRRTRR
ncbi:MULTISPECIES: hypothetical protein [Rhodococcus]|uniref:Uncharacterized protein n=1 Tax=Rhodococcus aetherivorans TaxID=191292 RepID=A0A059MUN1_9NOCA|nr:MULTISPECIES: hypothetical protein [Rhodococcus]NCL76445.1 hypothetical protein [Rhodococcus sp. YH1]AKE88712.1 hypothetical protein AAT18_05135 [Rhodococcus aetherivorans]ANZ26608.1 hypothetical protein A4U64_19410 [Rhodococcus sp. WB1]KDE14875.1 hypothetical protein N505_0101860 [Rhodococcus aetherivorans]MBC2591633.1 hypothetical protein [Rhodococcus aetherivorans]